MYDTNGSLRPTYIYRLLNEVSMEQNITNQGILLLDLQLFAFCFTEKLIWRLDPAGLNHASCSKVTDVSEVKFLVSVSSTRTWSLHALHIVHETYVTMYNCTHTLSDDN